MKGTRATETAKEIKFKGVWHELESKTGLQRQPVTRYLGLTLALMWGSALREGFLFFKCFLLALTRFSVSQGGWALGSHSMGCRHFPDIL